MREDVDSLIPRDIYNFRQKKHFKFLDGRSPIQALLTSLPDEGNWIFNYEKNTDDVVTALFCTHNLQDMSLYLQNQQVSELPWAGSYESQGLKRWAIPTRPKDHDSRLR